MKYIINEDKNLGIQNIDDEARNSILESLGYDGEKESEEVAEEVAEDAAEEVAEEVSEEAAEEVVEESAKTMTPREVVEESDESETSAAIYAWKGQYFTLEEDVYEFENELYVRVREIPQAEASELTEGKEDAFSQWVEFDGSEYKLQEVYDYDDDVYVKISVNEANGEDMSDDDIEATMNKAAEKKFGKGSKQAGMHKKASKLKDDPAAEKQAAADAAK